jgi:RHS repeat-associated protein
MTSGTPLTPTVTSQTNGNTLTDGTRTNTWDTQNRLVQCVAGGSGSSGTGSGSTTSQFVYGSDGMRKRGTVTASDGTKTRTDYVYDSSILVEEVVQHFSATGSALDSPTTTTYFQGPQGPLYRKASSTADPSWYVYDGLGSVVGEVDVNGNLTASKLFDVYGATRGGSGTPTTRQGFVGGLGHETDDETGLVYMRARYYDPTVGRFGSEDPGKQGANWYQYCNDDPINHVDNSGKDVVSDSINIMMWISMVTFGFSCGGDAVAYADWLLILVEIMKASGDKYKACQKEALSEWAASAGFEAQAQASLNDIPYSMAVYGGFKDLAAAAANRAKISERDAILYMVMAYTAEECIAWMGG